MDELADYWRLGYHIEKGIWTPEECDELTLAASAFSSCQTGTFSPLMQPHRTEPLFLDALRRPSIVSIAKELCSGQVSGLQSVWYYGAPHKPGFPLHQDNYFIEAPPTAFVSAWCAMQDVTLEMGALVGYPGSHEILAPEYPRRPDNINLFLYRPTCFAVAQGDVVFMHSLFAHESGTNITDHFRQALLLTYIRQGESFRPGDTAKREEVELYV